MRPITTRDGRAPVASTEADGLSRRPVAPLVPTPPAPKPVALLEVLSQRVDAELGSWSEGVQPLLHDVRQALLALDPPGDGMLPSPQDQQKLRAKATAALEEAEDVLEALQLGARSGGRRSG
ncbi:hypothetical protein D7Y13_20560 [Corallococcus praedator]|uniref:Uncharacterized protein n=1 Tax=Corallococcus praedator TaxID=2316724 RepID=A0ABX9QF84_9BACT|nr:MULTISPECIES: hypothetical protein [Corallococcus]RKH28625.1 hypothetical protein D7X75_24415 [Corallococcus sp. CA031C]RKI06271.1 hypothetical protein D7Y13_20560 [Corallococcus praedator]